MLAALGSVLLPRLASDPGVSVARYARLSAATTMFATAAMLLATPFALPTLFGPAFEAAAPATLLLVLAAGVAGLNGVLEEMLRGLGEPGWPLRAQLAGLVVTLGLLGLLLQRYAAVGAAVASVGSYIAILVVLLVGIRRRARVDLLSLVPGGANLRELAVALGFGRDSRRNRRD